MAIYEYRAKCRRVISGLTVELGVDLGFGIGMVRNFDLQGICLKEPSAVVRARVEELLFTGLDGSGINADTVARDLLIHTGQDTDGCYHARVMIFDDSPPLPAWKSVQGILLEEDLVGRL